MSNVHNVYNATIERRSERLPSVPGIGRGWPKPSSGSISDFGRHHPSYHPPPRFHIYGSIGSVVKPIVSCLMLLDIISLEKLKNWENFETGTISQNFYACGEIVTTVFS